MKEYFNNPEIKKSYIIFMMVMVIFLIANYITIQVSYENIRSDYIKVLGGMTAKLIEENPQLETKIVPLMTRESTKEEEERGKEILRQYGLNESLEVSLFPYIKDSFRNSMMNILLLGIILTGILFILNYIQYDYFYGNMRSFSMAAKKIVEGEYNLKVNETKEGDLSKLAQSFNAMGEVIRGNIFALKKEKNFLVELLSDISHQLKTPLSTMILYNDIMLSKDLTKEQEKTFLIHNRDQLNRMKWLILNLLKLAKIDANAIELEIKEQSLNKTIGEVIEILENKAIERNIKVDFISSKDIKLSHDRLWLQEAFVNVLKNGIEHAKEGSHVVIDVKDNKAYTKITIHNKGDIILEEDLVNIFKRFYKGTHSKKSDSIGIGLSLAKSIVEKHGGYIDVTSKIDEGTSFMITFFKF
ncbi:HAMP domain-containing sensor histidine kinase [Inediibacterium massiliense]|uniref:HAMP domain-containing sensor histidine kinase n=1 Tax=Inediibacterium massiliense TaxID=1658111 RepID=UPI0006B45822|nr:HAMP domain-containing sensor histidine kinase [Inediibacterium massiliense]